MPTYNVTGADTFTLGGRVFNDFADGDNITITMKGDSVNAKTGKNLNTIFSQNAEGYNGDIVLRLMRGSDDDSFLQGKLAASDLDFAASEVMNGQFTKRLGGGAGDGSDIKLDVHQLNGVMIKKRPDVKENVEGQTDQAVVVWTLVAAQVKRSTQ